MKSRVRQVLVAWICAHFSLVAVEPSQAQGQRIPPAPEPMPHMVGTKGCSLRGCHNGQDNGPRGAFRLWSSNDRHARAYDVLLESRSKLMAQALGLKEPAHEAKLCLRCHSTDALPMAAGAKLRVTEGVNCEVCHGPASQWLDPHIRREWRAQPASVKAQSGLRDLSSPRARVETCIDCHVGTPGFEVSHDLIAAGHPRLLFEATAFMDAMPHHWDEAKVRKSDPQFAAKLWFTGQTATLKRSLANLEARPADRVAFEFADHDCYACHRSLTSRSYEKPADRVSQTWGRWHAELTRLAEKRALGLPKGTMEDFAQLGGQVRVNKVDRSALQQHALSEKFAAWDRLADRTEWSPALLQAVMLECAAPIAPGNSEWEVGWQRYRALTALSQSGTLSNDARFSKVSSPLKDLRATLRGLESPVDFDREAFNRQLEAVRQSLPPSP